MKSFRNVIESTQFQPLQKGGPSSSITLNQIHDNHLKDILSLSAKAQELERRQAMLSVYLEQQATGISSIASNLSSLVPAAPGNKGVVDFFSSTYVGGANTAYIDQDYGQVTLPVLSTQEKMSGLDSQGNIWVPNDSRIRFIAQPGYTEGEFPNDDDYLSSSEDFYGIGNQSESFFMGGYIPDESYLFIKGILPKALNTSNLTNRLTFHPIPAFSHSLVSSWYKKTDGSWNSIDISYLPGYSGGIVPYLANTRLHFSAEEIKEVCIVLLVQGWWGISNFGAQFVTYNNQASLVADFSSYSPSTIRSISVQGKDSNVLNQFSTSLSGSEVTVAMSQTSSRTTPVITGVTTLW